MTTKGKVLLAVACVMLFAFSVTAWMAFDLFNSARFGQLVAEVTRDEAVVAAVSDEIVDQVFADMPVVREVLREPAGQLLLGISQLELVSDVVARAAQVAHVALTTDVQGTVDSMISVDLSRIVPLVLTVVEMISPESAQEAAAALAGLDQRIAMLDAARLPNLTAAANIAPWLWPIAGLAALALFWWVVHRSGERRTALRATGAAVAATGLLQLLLVPIARTITTGSVVEPLAKTIVAAAFGVLIRDFVLLSGLWLVLGLLLYGLSNSVFIAGWAGDAPELG